MAGFCGIYQNEQKFSLEFLEKMSAQIKHRGEVEHSEVQDNFLLSQRKLARESKINTHRSQQEYSRYYIGYDGALEEREAVKDLLAEKYGEDLDSASDELLLIVAYHHLGAGMMKYIKGLYAFVIYDSKTKHLFGARDRFGARPFFYTWFKDELIFASELKALVCFKDLKKRVNRKALKLYLEAQYNPLNETMIEGMFKLPPGHYFEYDGKNFKTTRYFEFTFDIDHSLSFQEAVEDVRTAVAEAVDQAIEGEDNFGSYLSGGIDSSYVVASVDEPITTYTAFFKQEGFDESGFSRALSDLLGKKNERVEISGDDFFNVLPEVQYYSDEPHANLSAVPLYFLSKLSEGEDFVLSGEGADEYFGGYDTYLDHRLPYVYKKVVPKSLRRKLSNWASGKSYFKGQGFLEKNGKAVEEEFIGQSRVMTDMESRALLKDDCLEDITFTDITKPYFERSQALGYDTLHQKMYLDFNIWLPDDIFVKGDRMAMANSQLVRMPLLSEKVWQVARRMPSKFLTNHQNGKLVLRKAAEIAVPEEWANREKKGFMVPIRYWLYEKKYADMVRDVFKQDYVGEFFDQDLLLKWVDDHQAGKSANQRKIYTVLAFLLWYERYFLNVKDEHFAR